MSSAAINALNFILILTTNMPLNGIGCGLMMPLLDLVGIFLTLCFAVGLTGLYALLGRRSALGISGLVLTYLLVLVSASTTVFTIGYFLYELLLGSERYVRVPWLIFPEGASESVPAS